MHSPLGFYFVLAKGRRSPEVLAFRDWLLEQFGVPGEASIPTHG
jgi:hypothetical protein